MNKEYACTLLKIDPHVLNENVLRKQYKLACLLNHPDKNKNKNESSELFIEIKEAYDFLLVYLENNSLFNGIDGEQLVYYVSMLNSFKENILENSIIQPILHYLKKCNIYELNPSIDQLFNKCVYLIESHYIPVWHNEINIDKMKIKIIPNLPDYIDIDMDNNIHIYLQLNPTETEIKTFILCGVSFLIDGNKKELCFKNMGIPIINEKNIYDVSILSDIIFHITQPSHPSS